ncbi:MAG: NAD(P)-binding domain-containing protein [Planctomycetota bacterium]|jgi:thioredoxin reductase/NAD-dependent dihydropyrimidine dehydrogenase PreA subunit
MSVLGRFADWLHLEFPAGLVERGPEVRAGGATNLPGVTVVGDLTGVPLLKFAVDTGAGAIEGCQSRAKEGELDLVIIGGGVAGMSTAVAAQKKGLRFVVIEASEIFSTIVNFPKKKLIFTYPVKWKPRGDLEVTSGVKEDLIRELFGHVEGKGLPVVLGAGADHVRAVSGGYEVVLKKGSNPCPWEGDVLPAGFRTPLVARHIVVALGRSGNFRRLGVPGEDLPQVSNRLIDPAKFKGQKVLVVGGGDSATEAAASIADAGGEVTLSYRKGDLTRPKPENVARVGERPIRLLLPSRIREIRADAVDLDVDGEAVTIENDAVLSLIGREPPLPFFRKSGIPIVGEMTAKKWAALGIFMVACTLMYLWKAGVLASGLDGIASRDPRSLLGAVVNATRDPSFYYSLAYSVCVVAFGFARMRRRKTPYVKLQTYTLMAIQVIPLFLLPQIVLPWMGANDWIPGWIREQFFPGDSWWRSYGLILAWPLFFWNLASAEPVMGWLVLSFVQTFVLIPWMIRRWGKGAYCGWICSCGALAETLGDTQRHKMPHGPTANRWNLAGQVVLVFAFAALVWRILGWTMADGNFFARTFDGAFATPWKYTVDIFLAGVLGIGVYFWFSGRVWCRFFCPLAALMHIYAKFTRYRILPDKERCISCNVCTSVCHQGIDIMSYANKGRAMDDVQCVRCSACVEQCPTGTLSFGRVDAEGGPACVDPVFASPVQMREGIDPEDVFARLRKRWEESASG